jgi:hypothetical protein
MLIAGTALIGIGIGFVAGSAGSEKGETARGEVAEISSGRTKSSRRTEGSGGGAGGSGKGEGLGFGSGKKDYSKMSAADALVMVKANADYVWGGDPLESARKNYEYQLLLSKLPAKVLEEVMEQSKVDGVPVYRIRQIFGTYASRDLNKAMAWAESQPDAESWKGAAISAVSAKDPARAMEMYQESLMEGGSATGPYSYEGPYSIAGSFAKQGKAALLQFLDSMPSNGAGNYVSNALRSLPKEDLPGFIEELDLRVKAGKLDDWAMNNALQNLATTDPAAARELLGKMEDGPAKAKRELSIAGTLAQQGKTAEAMELLKSAMAQQPGKEKEFLINEGGNLIYNNPTLITQMAAALPAGSELTLEDVKKLNERGYRNDPVNMAKLLKTPDEQATFLEGAIKNLGNRGNSKLNETDFRILEHRVQTLGLTGDNAAKVRQEIAAIREKAQGTN